MRLTVNIPNDNGLKAFKASLIIENIKGLNVSVNKKKKILNEIIEEFKKL